MSYHIRPALGTNAKPIIALYGLPASGKTKTALLIAKGFIDDMSKVVMIETERGRGEAYAKDAQVGGYLVRPIVDDFSPKQYGDAIQDAEKAGAKVLIIDSASHEWEGLGGVLAMAAANEEKGWKGQVVWTKPKMQHQREFVGRLLQSSFDLVIICCRAKYLMVEYLDDNKKKQMKRDDKPTPIQSDQFLGEVFAYGWLDEEHNYHAVRYTDDSLIQVLRNNKPLDIDSGRRLAEWDKSRAAGYEEIDHTQELKKLLKEANIQESELLAIAKRSDLRQISDIGKAKAWIEKNKRALHQETMQSGQETMSADEAFEKCDELIKSGDIEAAKELIPLLRSPDRRIVEDMLK